MNLGNIAVRKIHTMKKLFSTRTNDTALTIGLFLLRVGAGSMMLMNHGFDKLAHYSDKAHRFADPFGIGAPTSLALTVFAEFFCAAFLVLGLFTRLAAIPLVIAMSVALFFAHKGQIFGDGESAGIYLTCFLAILLMGPGRASLDRFIGK
jgi:putative oxidoreductase